MKILLMSDIHLRTSPTRNRIDNFLETQFSKLEWCFELAKKENCDLFLQGGDLFDSPRASDDLKRRLQSLLRKYSINFCCIFGQHDVRFRQDNLDNTPLGVVESSGLISILSDTPAVFDNVHIYGASWGQPIPQIQDKNAFNVLVIHKMVIQNEEDKIWHGQQNYSTARVLLAKNNFNLILSADNHKTFTDEYNNKTLLNLGSMTRLTSAQMEHKPQTVIFDTSKNEYTIYDIPIKPAEEVFNLEQIEKNRETGEINDKIREYVDLLGGNSEMREWNFVSNLDEFILVNGVRQEVQDIIKLALEVE